VPAISSFQPPLAKHTEFVQFLTRSDLTLHEIADAFDTTLEALTLYLTSDEGLAQVATTELACALRIRLAAMHYLPRAVDALGTMLEDYTQSTRNLPARESSSSLQSQTLREEQRKNARRASHLLFRIAHFTPRLIRAYTHTPHEPNLSTPPSTPPAPTPKPDPALAAVHAPTRETTSSQASTTTPTITSTSSERPTDLSHPRLQPKSEDRRPTNSITNFTTSEPTTPSRQDHAAPEFQNTS